MTKKEKEIYRRNKVKQKKNVKQSAKLVQIHFDKDLVWKSAIILNDDW